MRNSATFIADAAARGLVPGARVRNPYQGEWILGPTSTWSRGDDTYDGSFHPHGAWIFYMGSWCAELVQAPIDDDIIRVGDLVEIIDDSGCNAAKGRIGERMLVDRVDASNDNWAIVRCGEVHMVKHRFKKIKSAGLNPVQTNTNKDELQGTSQAQGSSSRNGRAVELRVRGGQVAMGVRHPGHPQAAERPRADVARGSFRPASRK